MHGIVEPYPIFIQLDVLQDLRRPLVVIPVTGA
jgi:hypothetical protein